jgi:hypothetical protein
MTFSSFVRVAAVFAVCASAASCTSSFPSLNGGLDQRYAAANGHPERAYVPAYRGWTMNYGERQAEKKAISQDMPFAAVRPSGL